MGRHFSHGKFVYLDMNISYRKTRRQDLDKGASVIKLAFNDLRKRSGLEREHFPRRHPKSFEHFLKTDGERSFCAWHGNKVVGYTQALVRGKQWYLALLFVHPKYQDLKVGKELLSRVWCDEQGMTHSLATFAYNPQALGIYSRFGMAPIAGIVRMSVPRSKLILPDDSGLRVRPMSGRADRGFVNSLETKVRGYARLVDWQELFSQKSFRRLIFLKAGEKAGYAVITEAGLIGPVGAISPKILIEVVKGGMHEASGSRLKSIALQCPAENIELYQAALKAGFRIKEMLVFMSDKKYADFKRYSPGPLAMF